MVCLPLAPLFLLALALSMAWLGRGGRVHVMRVVDGDTLIVARPFGPGERVRLVGVDAPEFGAPGGDDSRRFVASLVDGRWVKVRRLGVDLYGRPLVSLEARGRDLAEELVRSGRGRPMLVTGALGARGSRPARTHRLGR